MVDQTQDQAALNYQSLQEQLRALTEAQNALLAKAGTRIGMPDRPKFDSLLDKDTGLMPDQYQLDNQYDTSALDAMKAEALRDPGQASVWRQAMEDQLNVQAGQAKTGAQKQTSAMMNQLAMKGGLESGAAERLASQGVDRGIQAEQQVRGQGINLDIQDESQRLQQLGGVNQSLLQQAEFGKGVEGYNIEKALNETLQKRAADINTYNEQMRAWAAEKTAAATPSGGGGGKK